MSHEELGWKSYEGARQELVERIRTRDVILFGSLTAIGTLFGYALKEKDMTGAFGRAVRDGGIPGSDLPSSSIDSCDHRIHRPGVAAVPEEQWS